MDYHFIYLIKEKQDIDNNEPIFKIGKSTQENTRRVKSYPSGSHLLLQIACIDCHSMEDYLLQQFNRLFTLARGREYFNGCVFKMINLIFFIIQSEVTPHRTEYMVTDNHNLSLYVNTDKHNEIIYSFNNKDNILDEHNRALLCEKRKYRCLDVKHNYCLHDNKHTINQLNNTITTLQDNINKEDEDKTMINDTIVQLRSNIKINDHKYMKTNKQSDTMYYTLFTYMTYSMLYQLYVNPYRIVNWIFLSVSMIFIYCKHPYV